MKNESMTSIKREERDKNQQKKLQSGGKLRKRKDSSLCLAQRRLQQPLMKLIWLSILSPPFLSLGETIDQ